jgi:hypothetical protein
MPSSDSRDSISSRRVAKLAKICALGSLLMLLSPMSLHGHKVTSDYELTPIALPGANGTVALDYFTRSR